MSSKGLFMLTSSLFPCLASSPSSLPVLSILTPVNLNHISLYRKPINPVLFPSHLVCLTPTCMNPSEPTSYIDSLSENQAWQSSDSSLHYIYISLFGSVPRVSTPEFFIPCLDIFLTAIACTVPASQPSFLPSFTASLPALHSLFPGRCTCWERVQETWADTTRATQPARAFPHPLSGGAGVGQRGGVDTEGGRGQRLWGNGRRRAKWGCHTQKKVQKKVYSKPVYKS